MNKKNKLLDFLGILSNLLIAIGCFLPFIDYTTLVGIKTITYFQANGKILLVFSVLAILLIIIKKFKYIVICLGLSIGILLYDVGFGLLEVVGEKTTTYSLKYGFYFIIVGIIINFVYIILKIKTINHLYNENNNISEANSQLIDEVGNEQKNNDKLEKKKVDNNIDVNPQTKLLDGYQFDNDENFISNETFQTDNYRESNSKTITGLELKEDYSEEIIPSLENNLPNITDSDLLSNSDINDDKNDNKLINNKNMENKPLYKLCDNCGMQINYTDEQCPVCGKYF